MGFMTLTHLQTALNKIKTILDTKANKTEIPTTLPANGGNANTVNGHTVESDVPASAKFTDTTYSPATSTTNGLMSSDDKVNLDTHIADNDKHITSDERTIWNGKADKTAATPTKDGMMSAADKKKLDNIDEKANKYTLPVATSSILGGVKLGYSTNGKNYKVTSSNADLYVNVPWTDTKYSNFVKSGSGAKSGLVPAPSTTAGTTKYLREDGTWTVPPDTTYGEVTQSTAGLMSAADKKKLDGIAVGAEANVQSDWNITNKNSDAFIKNKPESLPANGGNADTVDGLHANEIASNPNLLINPDFRINQRGLTEYTGTALYTVDRWRKGFQYQPTSGDVVVTTSESGSITITNSADKSVTFAQKVENPRFLYGKTVTASARINGVTYMATGTVLTTGKGTILRMGLSSKFDFTIYQDCSIERFDFEIHIVSGVTATIDWAKLEIGSIATPFCPPDPATELAKCQRYFYRLGGLKNNFVLQGLAYSPTSMSFTCQFPVEMRTLPTLSVSKGNWRFRIQKIPHGGNRYWNNEYGFVFSVDANFSYSQRVSINVNFDDTKSTIITAGDPVTIETNPDSDSSGNQKYPGWLDFDAEL